MSAEILVRARSCRTRLWRGAWLAPLIVGPAWAALCTVLIPWPWPGFGSLAGAVLAMLWAVTSYSDMVDFRIPNWATYPAVGWSLLVHAGVSVASQVGDRVAVSALAARWLTPLSGMDDAVLGLLAGGVPLGVIYALTGKGAGDVKLAAAIGCWVGPRAMVLALVGSYCLAGVYAVARALWVVGPWPVVRHLALVAGSFLAPNWIRFPRLGEQPGLSEPVPMAGFFAVGTAVTLTWYTA